MESEMSRALKGQRDRVLDSWIQKVAGRTRAKDLPREAVLNNIPRVLNEIIEAIADPEQGGLRAVILIPREAGERHGEDRLNLGYELNELGSEYNSLREAILDALDAANVRIRNNEARALHAAIDQAHRAGVERFISLQETRLEERQSDFLARLAHDFRTPLATVLAGVHLVGKHCPEEAKTLGRMERAARRVLRMIEGQLVSQEALSGNLHIQTSDVPIKELVDEVFEMVRSTADAKAIELVERVGPRLRLKSDALLLGQMIQNLVENALKYTQSGKVTVSAEARGDGVSIAVEDTGRGIPANLVPAIFRIYGRTEHRTPGHGVGLAVVKSILDVLGGTIEVMSTEGKGSRFTAVIPSGTAVSMHERPVWPAH